VRNELWYKGEGKKADLRKRGTKVRKESSLLESTYRERGKMEGQSMEKLGKKPKGKGRGEGRNEQGEKI